MSGLQMQIPIHKLSWHGNVVTSISMSFRQNAHKDWIEVILSVLKEEKALQCVDHRKLVLNCFLIQTSWIIYSQKNAIVKSTLNVYLLIDHNPPDTIRAKQVTPGTYRSPQFLHLPVGNYYRQASTKFNLLHAPSCTKKSERQDRRCT